MDMPAIQELSDDRLRELSAAKPTDLDRAQAKVATPEVQFAAARAAHAKNFPRDPRATDPKCQESLQAVDRVENELHRAKKRLALIEAGVRSVELQRTREEAPEASYIFEVTSDDGRKMRQSAKDAATLQRSLSKGYTVTGRVFPHYTAPVDATAPNLLNSLLRAHPRSFWIFLLSTVSKGVPVMRRILTKFRIEEISAIDKPAASHCRALIVKGQAAMTPLQEFTKIETDAEAIRFVIPRN